MTQYGGAERASAQSYASGGTRITHNYTITHLDDFGKVAYIEWYETPYGRPFGLGGNQHVGTYYPKLDEYEPTVNGYPDADAFGSSEIGKSKIINAAKESSRDAIRELNTNNNTSGLTPSQIATETNQTVTSMFNYNSTTETIDPNQSNPTQPGDGRTGSTETTTTGDDTTTDTQTDQANFNTTTGVAQIQDFEGTGDPDAGRDLRYPFDHTSAYDFIKIFPMKYIPAMQSGNVCRRYEYPNSRWISIITL
jgi:hypothetical protein